jgi:excisionase family DNA binding protein
MGPVPAYLCRGNTTIRNRKRGFDMQTLELPGYTIREAENILSLPEKTLYRLIREQRITAYRDSTGQLRISPFELYAYQRRS